MHVCMWCRCEYLKRKGAVFEQIVCHADASDADKALVLKISLTECMLCARGHLTTRHGKWRKWLRRLPTNVCFWARVPGADVVQRI